MLFESHVLTEELVLKKLELKSNQNVFHFWKKIISVHTTLNPLLLSQTASSVREKELWFHVLKHIPEFHSYNVYKCRQKFQEKSVFEFW